MENKMSNNSHELTVKRSRLKALELGLCANCAKNPLVSALYCSECLTKKSNHGKSVYIQRLEKDLCTRCGKNIIEPNTNRCKSCLVRGRINAKVSGNNIRKRNKLLIMQHYSKLDIPKCACCGETEIDFLSLDHINGGGNKHRKSLGIRSIYSWIIKNNFPDGFQVLCMNCQFGKQLNNGVCPHKKGG